MTGAHYAGFSVQGHILSTAGAPLKSFLFVCKTIQMILEGSGQPEFVHLIETLYQKAREQNTSLKITVIKSNVSSFLSFAEISPEH
jgi:hypothetical protein